MQCVKCDYDNPADALFCMKCGTKVENRCPSCNTVNPADANFCRKCGGALAGASGYSPAAALKTSSIEVARERQTADGLDGERKTVTALFADIKGSTEMMRDLDPEEARAIVDPVLKLMMDAVHRYDGYVAQSTGDGIFALFGAPVAHEDHPRRALHAAIAMRDELRRHAAELTSRGRPAVETRIGVNTGEVVLRTVHTGGHTEYSPVGHAANLAARMQAVAPAGSIVVSGETRRLVEGYFELRDLGPAEVRGISEPVNVYEVVGAGAAHGHFELAARRGLTKFVGREHELEQMKRALELARSGRGQLVAVVAEAGTGKSRLVYEFKATIPAGWKVLEAYSVSHGKASAYLPVLELLYGYFGIEDADDTAQRRGKIEARFNALDPALNDTLPLLYTLMGLHEGPDPIAQMDPQIKRKRTLEAIKRIILRESLKQPVVAIFEDLHWIDGQTQALLDLLADGFANSRTLLLFNYRPEYRHEWGNKSYYSQIRLDALDPESATEMLATLLGTAVEFNALRRLIIERTEGNPFFIEEMVQALFDEGVLVRNGGVKVTRSLSQLQLPPTVQGILASRIDRLPAEHKQLLQTLAVIGRQSPFGLIRQVVSTAETPLQRMLAELQAGEFIYERPALPEVEYVFKHALTQEVAYNSLLVERRKLVHERIAETIESLRGEQLNDYVKELAHHYSRGNGQSKAVTFLRLAGEQAVRRSATAEAVADFTAAVEILERMPRTSERDEQELDLLTELGPALMSLKGFGAPECEELYRRARDLCVRIGETPRLYTVLWGQWMSRSVQAKWDDALALTRELLAIANNVHEPVLMLEAHHAAWNTLVLRGELEGAQVHVKEGLALYDPDLHQFMVSQYGGHDPAVCGYSHGAVNLWLLGKPDQSLDMIKEGLALAERLGHDHSTARAAVAAAWLHQLRGEEHAVAEHARAAVDICQKNGFAFWEAFGQMLLGWADAAQGQVDEGITLMRLGLAEYRRTGAEEQYGYFLLLLADRLAQAGATDEGLTVLSEASDLLRNGERFFEAEIHRVTAELLLKQNPASASAARAMLESAITVSRQQSAKSLELRATTSLARLLAQQGHRDEARAMLAEIYDWFTEGFDTADLKDAKALLDELGG
jgi:class 3 adenylate cyclase/predicted ATPase